MSRIFTQPNLAAKLKPGEDYDTKLGRLSLSEGFFLSPKLDGVRITVHPEWGAVTRTLKEIPNRALHKWFYDNRELLEWFDGELTFGNHEDPTYSFQKTMSVFSTEDDGSDDWKGMVFNVFDCFGPYSFAERIRSSAVRIREIGNASLANDRANPLDVLLRSVEQVSIYSVADVYTFEEVFLARGYEGAMIRHRNSLYKCGRSTWREQGLIAIKRFEDAEATIVGFEELQRNGNEATIDARGLQQRSSHQGNKTPGGTLGKLLVRGSEGTPFEGIEFAVGSGFNAEQRQTIWDEGIVHHLGRAITFKYQPVGVKEKPRAPIFKGFRGDM